MAIKRLKASIDVVEAAKIRIKNVFKNGVPVYLSFSGGKDSLCMAQLIVELIQESAIDPSRLVVQFIDEEAIFPCIEQTVLTWRKKFIMLGAQFQWYCIQVKHYNCFNQLSNDESFICWDQEKEDVWVRKPPSFAIRTHPLLKSRIDTYQDFLPRICIDGIGIVGIRTAESIQRLKNIASFTNGKKHMTNRQQVFPIYDWQDKDVWLYLKQAQVDIPDIYLYLWQSGQGKNQMRVSQFFSVDTARSLVKMDEYYPDLMNRVIRREPNAYLAALYWDSEMFGRQSTNRRQAEQEQAKKDYKAELLKVLGDRDKYFPNKHAQYVANQYRKLLLRTHTIIVERDYQKVYEGLMAGDPKLRTLRALYEKIFSNYSQEEKGGLNGDN